MTKKALEKLKAKLPKGYARIIHERIGATESGIYKTLCGYYTNPNMDIINAAIELAQESANKNNDMVNQIKSL